MLCKEVENNTGMLLYYSLPVIQESVFEPQKPVIYTSYTYTQNTVIYNATATQKGVYRYSYAINNPMMYTDPDGEFANIIFGAIMGGFSVLCTVL